MSCPSPYLLAQDAARRPRGAVLRRWKQSGVEQKPGGDGDGLAPTVVPDGNVHEWVSQYPRPHAPGVGVPFPRLFVHGCHRLLPFRSCPPYPKAKDTSFGNVMKGAKEGCFYRGTYAL